MEAATHSWLLIAPGVDKSFGFTGVHQRRKDADSPTIAEFQIKPLPCHDVHALDFGVPKLSRARPTISVDHVSFPEIQFLEEYFAKQEGHIHTKSDYGRTSDPRVILPKDCGHLFTISSSCNAHKPQNENSVPNPKQAHPYAMLSSLQLQVGCAPRHSSLPKLPRQGVCTYC